MLEMINFVFPNSALMVSSSKLGSDSDSTDDGCMEKVIPLSGTPIIGRNTLGGCP